MRISDWSSDVCSSDLLDKDRITLSVTSPENGTAAEELAAGYDSEAMEIGFNARYLSNILGQVDGDSVELHLADANAPTLIRESEKSPALYVLMPMRRSEEHTSELQSLMRISYAVFCLKKQNNRITTRQQR